MSFAEKKALSLTCHALIPGIDPPYGYQPSLAAGIVFCVLFGLSMLVHTVQALWKRNWWCFTFVVGCITEVLGWAARTWSSQCPYNGNAFLMQISTLIIAPTFFTAGIYVLLGRFIQIFGRNSSVLSPAMYLWIFCTCDVVSLVVQAIGGGIASSESNQNTSTKPGTDIMVAGIIFQLASITIFVACAADFFRRVLRHHRLSSMSGTVVPLMAAMAFSITCIYIRSIYRTIELLQGWSGYLITHERFFIALDGAMMAPAVAIFNFIHPGWFIPSQKTVSVDVGQEMSSKSSERPVFNDA
ncbi:hypothetical protein DTO021D3_5035 [Paecilomyces variotii]|nr:hypothetical protein DTO032I3_6857 [Paecilomyces variotii]KAJ9220802.1 hypothetical protein DTO169C6_6887 [Paecilomyces variotii]KAJ9265439.1 hypothetical protein DTO195F2_1785 [Paecilomyces variotii]KAJ9278068.1 hypothetical protein DTO021D3_5035 [Paecilomyces variotii]KAJ9345843.1 hypothetical protein DTO027B6_1803 [Paecilomyces variotii]